MGNNQSISDKLASLESEFNTNAGFGFMGMLNSKDQGNSQELPVSVPEIKEETKEVEDPPKWFAPLNTSIQAIRGDVNQQIGRLQQDINTLKQTGPTAPTNYNDVPEEVAPVINKLNNVDRTLATLALKQEFARAKDALRDARTKYKDFNYTEDELNQIWNSHVGNNPNVAASTNWNSYFDTQYQTRTMPKLAEENARLKSDIEKLKNGRNSVQDLYSVPRSSKINTPARSNNNEFDEELYRRAANKMGKGTFIGFNKALLDEQRKMSLTA